VYENLRGEEGFGGNGLGELDELEK